MSDWTFKVGDWIIDIETEEEAIIDHIDSNHIYYIIQDEDVDFDFSFKEQLILNTPLSKLLYL